MPLLLDLFCGAGGAAAGYHRAGWEVVGVDNSPQPNYPFRFILADALRPPVYFSRFDAVHASPPCQAFTPLRVMKNAKPHADLLTLCREMLRGIGLPYVIENVPGAPMRRDIVLCGSMFGLGTEDGSAQLRRHRYFETNWQLTRLVPPCSHDARKPVEVYGHGSSGRVYRKPRTVTVAGKPGGSSSRDRLVAHQQGDRCAAMGIDWMTRSELAQAIPPAYTELIGEQLLRSIRGG